MKLKKVQELLDARVLACGDKLDREIKSACGSDLMSDVLAFSKEKVVMLTGLVNPQVIRTAEMMDIGAVMFVRGKEPTDEVIRLAEEKNIVTMATEKTMFIACGILYSEGLGRD